MCFLYLIFSCFSKYPVERKTLNHRISYYVKENFGTEYQGSLGRLESAVEEEYIVNMKRACFSEKNYRKLNSIIQVVKLLIS